MVNLFLTVIKVGDSVLGAHFDGGDGEREGGEKQRIIPQQVFIITRLSAIEEASWDRRIS